MVVVMKERASDAQVEKVIAHLVELGMDVHRSSGASRIVLGVVGSGKVDPRLIEMLDGVHEVLRISEPYKLASRTFKPDDTVFASGEVRIGGDEVIVMAGPVLGRDRDAGQHDRRGGQARRRQGACAAARSSRAARPTASRASAKRGCRCCGPRPTPTT